MEPQFWLNRWEDGQTHFHQERAQPLLLKNWPTLGLPPGSRVLVPLCGKTLDLIWLAEQGHTVLGIELSPIAIEQFFSENALPYTVRKTATASHYVAGDIEIICGDIFDVEATTLAQCRGVYDRAALIALPSAIRSRYVQHVYANLPRDYRGLLITLDYPQDEKNGPPFSVADDDVHALFGAHSKAELRERRDILSKEPRFIDAGVSRLDTLVYRLSRR